MAITFQPWSYIDLTKAVNEILAPKTFIADTLYRGREEQHTTETIALDKLLGNQKMAPIVRRTGQAVPLKRTADKMQMLTVPRLRMKMDVPAGDVIDTRTAGQNIFNPTGAPIAEALTTRIAKDMRDMRDRIERRIEWYAAQSLGGIVTYVGEEVSLTIDYLMPAANKPVLAGADLWSSADSLIINKLRQWQHLINRKTGATQFIGLGRTSVIDNIFKNNQVKSFWASLNQRVDIAALSLEGFQGGARKVMELANMPIYEYDNIYETEAGVEQYFLPDDVFVVIGTDADFRLHYASIADLDVGANVAAPFFSKQWVEEDPSVLWTAVESSPLPVPHRPDAIVYADVQ